MRISLSIYLDFAIGPGTKFGFTLSWRVMFEIMFSSRVDKRLRFRLSYVRGCRYVEQGYSVWSCGPWGSVALIDRRWPCMTWFGIRHHVCDLSGLVARL